jgi:hypothetical protein
LQLKLILSLFPFFLHHEPFEFLHLSLSPTLFLVNKREDAAQSRLSRGQLFDFLPVDCPESGGSELWPFPQRM